MAKCCIKMMIKSMMMAMVLFMGYVLGMEDQKTVDKC